MSKVGHFDDSGFKRMFPTKTLANLLASPGSSLNLNSITESMKKEKPSNNNRELGLSDQLEVSLQNGLERKQRWQKLRNREDARIYYFLAKWTNSQ